jgi:hypothetical protein
LTLRTRSTALGGRSAGSLSTARHHQMCVMLNIRPDRRNTSAQSTKRSPRERLRERRARGGAARDGFVTLRTRNTVLGGRSAGCLSTIWYQQMCVMLNIRSRGPHTGARSMRPPPREPRAGGRAPRKVVTRLRHHGGGPSPRHVGVAADRAPHDPRQCVWCLTSGLESLTRTYTRQIRPREPRAGRAPRNGKVVTEACFHITTWTWRLYEYRMTSTDSCDA